MTLSTKQNKINILCQFLMTIIYLVNTTNMKGKKLKMDVHG